jgi:shikimate dehydrogenase
LFREDDVLVGENTEGKGLLVALGAVADPAGRKAMVLGAGKVARSIAVELALAKAAQIVIVDRDLERAGSLVALLRERLDVSAAVQAWEDPLVVPADAEILINATLVGRENVAGEIPLAADALRPEMLVADVTLNPPRTNLVDMARAAGCNTIDGLEMFIQQSAVAFQRWTGVDPDISVMREAVEEFLLL